MFKPEIPDVAEGRTPLSVIGHTPTSLQKLLLSDWLLFFSPATTSLRAIAQTARQSNRVVTPTA